MSSCEESTIILLELIDKRKDSILFFKGKRTAFSELVSLASQFDKNSIKLKSAACEVLTKILDFPVLPLLSQKREDLEAVAKDITRLILVYQLIDHNG